MAITTLDKQSCFLFQYLIKLKPDFVSEDEEHSEDEEGSILHEDGHDDTEYIRGTAAVGRLGDFRSRDGASLLLSGFRRRENEGELKHTPRPDRQNHGAQVAIVFNLHRMLNNIVLE